MNFEEPLVGARKADVPPSGLQPDVHHGWQPPSLEELRSLLPQYEFIEMVGRGGMGAVYKARQLTLDRFVAIKILPPGLDDDNGQFKQRFRQEARTMARLNHPHIANVYDFGQTAGGQLYFVMEFVDGTDVQKLIRTKKNLPPDEAQTITADVCDALSYAHEHGIIHRDIKPANVLMAADGTVKIADFGLAKTFADANTMNLTMTNQAVGSPHYVAPEAMIPGAEVDQRADLYAVGVMLYNMLTGEIPSGVFTAASEKTGCDERFDRIVMKAMESDREDRYGSAAEIRADLDAIQNGPDVVASSETLAPSRPGRMAARLVAVVAVTMSAILVFNNRPEKQGGDGLLAPRVWDATADYSGADNPNGAWSYGRKGRVDGKEFDLMTVKWGTAEGWYLATANGSPSMMNGPRLWAYNNSNGHPAVRWKCPKAGLYDVSGKFSGSDPRGVDTLVYVVVNGATQFSGRVSGPQASAPFSSGGVRLAENDVIDFVVSWAGEDGLAIASWTSLAAVISEALPQQALRLPSSTNLIAWWKGDGNALDSVGTNHGALKGDVQFTQGRFGKAFLCNGGFVEIPDAPDLRIGPDSDATITVWAKRAQPQLPYHILGKRLGCEGGRSIDYQIGLDGSGPATPVNEWIFWTLVNSGGNAALYTNGKWARSWRAFRNDTAAPLRIGTSGDCGGVFFGLIEDVRLYNRALQPDEIMSLYLEHSTSRVVNVSSAADHNPVRVADQ